MQRRLTLALVAVAMTAIVLVGAGVLLFAQVGARSAARESVEEQLFALQTLTARGEPGSLPDLGPAIRRVGEAFGDARTAVGVIDRTGTLRTLSQRGGPRVPTITPPTVTLNEADRNALQNGDAVLTDQRRTVIGILALDNDRRGDPTEQTAVLWVQRDVGPIPRAAVQWFVGSAAVVLVVSVLVAAWLARRFTEPVRVIQRATAAIAGGRLDTRIPTTGSDELGRLSASVNTMAADLGRARAAEQQFLLSITHDLRTPLTSIAGYAEALIDGAATDTEGAARVIAGNAERLNRLVDDLLTLAKLESDAFTFHVHEVDLVQLAREQLASAEPHAKANAVSLELVMSPNAALVRADPDRVKQILDNLIENAVKFAGSAIAVGIVGAVDDAPAGRVSLYVEDDGPGIANEDLPYVFDRLYVSSLMPQRAENSSGLGLAIVKDLVAAMGGSVRASSSPLGGSRITVELPGVLADTPAT